MPIPIPAIAPQAAAGLSTSKPPAASAPGFTESLMHLVDAVDSSAGDANSAVEKMLDGTGDVHDAMIALQRADMTLQFSVQVKNKFVQAYQEIMRMPV
jgi:flagellar hook-basal body complex protein FliE